MTSPPAHSGSLHLPPPSLRTALRCLPAPSYRPDPEARRGQKGPDSAPCQPRATAPMDGAGEPTDHTAGSQRLGTEPGSFIYTSKSNKQIPERLERLWCRTVMARAGGQAAAGGGGGAGPTRLAPAASLPAAPASAHALSPSPGHLPHALKTQLVCQRDYARRSDYPT